MESKVLCQITFTVRQILQVHQLVASEVKLFKARVDGAYLIRQLLVIEQGTHESQAWHLMWIGGQERRLFMHLDLIYVEVVNHDLAGARLMLPQEFLVLHDRA
jgi:hypothetical protein